MRAIIAAQLVIVIRAVMQITGPDPHRGISGDGVGSEPCSLGEERLRSYFNRAHLSKLKLGSTD